MYIHLSLLLACGDSSEKELLVSSPEKQIEEVDELPEDNQNNDNQNNENQNNENDNNGNDNIEPTDGDTSSPHDTGQPSQFSLYNFTLTDVNPFSSSYGSDITPSDYLGQVSGWYFIKAT